MQKQHNGDGIRIRGFVRTMMVNHRTGAVEIREVENAITANGFQAYLVGASGGIAGSKQITHVQLATQTTAPSSAQTSASGEFEARKSTSNSFVANGTLRMTAQFATNEATQSTLGGIAAYNTSSGGTAASVATFATSNKTTDQTLNVTYEWRFS
jgi:hypothetical protein